ncbi:growth/differentiation factor 8 [Lingula anatina]|uniref:Growth/differentiation factor 8 n=1 Tax=Lingula anatina TaxID=7574 RepID=A0A1S3HU52_LINAN|nr:growth/differentiation factor 8 [Lingula anatina]|eukprot:XP_013388584.1 growth/differentiation factor 8 [Lingula anatina]
MHSMQYCVSVVIVACVHLACREPARAMTVRGTTEEDFRFPHQNSYSDTHQNAAMTSSSASANQGQAQPKNYILTDQQLHDLRLEMIKKQILDKLQMTHRPNITTNRNKLLPAPLAQRLFKDPDFQATEAVESEGDDFYGKTTEMVVFADQDTTNCRGSKPSACFRFNLKATIDPDEISSAHLWVYKKASPRHRNATLMLSETFQSGHHLGVRSRRVAMADIGSGHGWFEFHVKHLAKNWLANPNNKRGIKISCKACKGDGGIFDSVPVETEGDLRPFLVIKSGQSKNRHRQKRNTVCDGNTAECCKQTFYVSFEAIGWTDWILQPSGYYANYCKGSCEGSTLPRSHHTTVIQTAALLERDVAKREELTPCCNPKKMSHISLLYYDNDGRMYKQNMPDMVVESCACS